MTVAAVKFNLQSAKAFDRYSEVNAAQLEQAALDRGCECVPYEDWFTYRRWLAQAQQVQKGEKSTQITVMVSREDRNNPGQTITKPWRAYVFCRCQVKEADNGRVK